MGTTRERIARVNPIERYDDDGKRVHGWLVRFKRRGIPTWKWFIDSTHGGRQEAWRAAVAYRDRMLRKLPPALHVKHKDKRNKTGAIGVHVDWSRDKYGIVHYGYRAVWTDLSGRVWRRCFSVRKYGRKRARELAVRARLQGLRELAVATKAAVLQQLPARESLATRRGPVGD